MDLNYPENLPICREKDRIVEAIRTHQVLVVAGDTGSGKTTQLPKMCLEAGRGKEKMIGCTQPRRLAAIAMAERVAEELHRPDLVGATIRFRDRTTENTRIKFMTDGILLAESRRDRGLSLYDTIILDEAHERSLNIDFLLGYLKQLLPRRPDLQLIISSATIDTDKFSAHFDNASIIEVSGRTYPITIQYQDESTEENQESYVDQACTAVTNLCERPGGDILVFMPTERDILDSVSALQGMLAPDRHLILPLFGRLQAADQHKIFRPCPKRKIIVATNVAETSITVPGIRFVVDTGLARIPAYNVRARTTSLLVSRISRASCDQRTGRCGRTGPGTCIRMYSEEDYLGRPEFTRPEILRSNLAEVILQMIDLKLGHPAKFPFLDRPAQRTVNDGFRLLRELGATNEGDRLTARGRIMARLPLDPCIARTLIEGGRQGALREIAILCAALSIQDPRTRPANKEKEAEQAQQQFIDTRSDFLTLLTIWNSWTEFSGGRFSSSKLRKFCTTHYLSWQRMREWLDIYEQITGLLKSLKGFQLNSEPASYGSIHQSLVSGFLRNIGHRKEKNIYTVSGGREVTLFPGSCLYNKNKATWIVAADFVETSRLFARTAAIIDAAWLESIGGDLCRYSYSDPHWSKKSGQVRAIERVSLFGLPIVAGRPINYGRINAKTMEEARDIFIHHALIGGELGGNYPFLKANLALTKKITTLEDRIRRRSILADDQVLYEFYRARINNAYDRYTFNRLLKKEKGDDFLLMREQDICKEMPARDEFYRFPRTLRAGELELPLQYHFQPGSDRDGVTVLLSPAQLNSLSPTLFEWLVPGLLDEKILHLLKRLPKTLRRRLVPLPDTVDRIIDRLDIYKGSLYAALEKALLREFRLKIQRSDWQTETLPPHLLMRYQLLGDRKNILCTSRNFDDLLSYRSQRPQAPDQRRGHHQNNIQLPRKTGLKTWDFDGLPARIPVTTDSGAGLYFPALLVTDNGLVDLKYIEDEAKARLLTRQGMEFLYCLQFPGCRQQILKACKNALVAHSASWLSLGMPGKASDLREALVNFIMDGLFHTRDGRIPEKSRFNAICTELNEYGFYKKLNEMLQALMQVLSERRKAVFSFSSWKDRCKKNRSFNPDFAQNFTESLENILPADFLLTRSMDQLTHTGRYLQALVIRLERAEHDPVKDAQKQQRLTNVVNSMVKLKDFNTLSSECMDFIALYRSMVEEFRVSIFAPELGTSMPVSEKRLRKLWQEMENRCRRVE